MSGFCLREGGSSSLGQKTFLGQKKEKMFPVLQGRKKLQWGTHWSPKVGAIILETHTWEVVSHNERLERFCCHAWHGLRYVTYPFLPLPKREVKMCESKMVAKKLECTEKVQV